MIWRSVEESNLLDVAVSLWLATKPLAIRATLHFAVSSGCQRWFSDLPSPQKRATILAPAVGFEPTEPHSLRFSRPPRCQLRFTPASWEHGEQAARLTRSAATLSRITLHGSQRWDSNPRRSGHEPELAPFQSTLVYWMGVKKREKKRPSARKKEGNKPYELRLGAYGLSCPRHANK